MDETGDHPTSPTSWQLRNYLLRRNPDGRRRPSTFGWDRWVLGGSHLDLACHEQYEHQLVGLEEPPRHVPEEAVRHALDGGGAPGGRLNADPWLFD